MTIYNPAALSLLAERARRAWEANARWWVSRQRDDPRGDTLRRTTVTPRLQEVLLSSRGRILDLACGEGYLRRVLPHNSSSIVGVDWSETMITAARSQGTRAQQDEWIVGDASGNLPFRDGAFDVVVSCLAAMDTIDLSSSFADARRVVAVSGQGYWIVPDPDGVDASPDAYFEIVREEPVPVPDAEWSAWVKIAKDEPCATLYIHRSRQAYKTLLAQAGWAIERTETLASEGALGAVLFETTNPHRAHASDS